jgi:hypothetical protein
MEELMQIPGVNLVSSLAGLAGKPASDSASPSETSPTTKPAQVEQTAENNPDRDAQGQGDGLARRNLKKRASHEQVSADRLDAANDGSNAAAPNLPDEPPGALDIIG